MSLIPQSILILQYCPFSPEIMLESLIRMNGQEYSKFKNKIKFLKNQKKKRILKIVLNCKWVICSVTSLMKQSLSTTLLTSLLSETDINREVYVRSLVDF